jgi:lipopolysaccharide/colanic/teichoic acid biosynthesis glycosyltransferase
MKSLVDSVDSVTDVIPSVAADAHATTVKLHAVPQQRAEVAEVADLPAPRVTTGFWGVAKLTVDVLAAFFLVVLALPVLLAIAVAVKLDGGPVFYKQTRVGRHGDEFKMIKFRSMVVDADAKRTVLEAVNEGAGPLFKMKRDPRVTRVGGVLRRYSLDELPQLLNVLNGTMSLIGPRPALPKEVAAYPARARRRLVVRPGMTGLWQVSGRSDLSWDESISLDLRYVDEWTPKMELKIIAGTAGAVIGAKGAY